MDQHCPKLMRFSMTEACSCFLIFSAMREASLFRISSGCSRLQWFPWSLEEVNSRLQTIMQKSFAAIYETAQQQEVNMRTAALVRAVDRVADFTRLRGIFP